MSYQGISQIFHGNFVQNLSFYYRENVDLPDIIFIQRGRIYWQKILEEVNKEVLEALQE
jgi:hypothetical protein